MWSEIATSTLVLKAERERLDGLLAKATDAAASGVLVVRRARDQLSGVIEALERAAPHLDAEAVDALADRIVLIEPGETFRTKIKLKATEQQPASPGVSGDQPSDDLTSIRGIDRALAKALGQHGVVSFAQIAAWEKDDVARLSAALTLGRQISRQNWIEQAAQLRARKIVPKAPAPEPQIEQPLGAPQPVPAALPVRPDRLMLIKGVGSSMARPLADGGVTRFADIAVWQRSDVAFWQDILGAAARISKDGWIEQAAFLARGRYTSYAEHVNAGFPASTAAMPASEALPDPVFSAWWSVPETLADTKAEVANVILESATPPEPISVAECEPADALPAVAVAESHAGIRPLSTMDRVSALEQELVSLVANDTTMPASLHIDREHQQEAEAYPSFSGEADVVIVRNESTPPATQRVAAPFSPRTKQAVPTEDIEPETFGAYKNRVEEASVEIVGSKRATAVMIAPSEDPAWQRYAAEGVTRPISRLFRGLIRRY